MREEALDDSTLELLVPEGGELQRMAREAFALVRALGEFAGPNAQVPVDAAHEMFERENRARAGGAIEDLLAHHLSAVDGGRGFLVLPAARVPVQTAWETLLHLQCSSPDLPGVPGPGETPLAVAGRLLEGLYRLEWEEDLLELWRARVNRASQGQRAGEQSFREGLAGVPPTGPGSRTYGQWLMGLAECMLDRGAVREARELLNEVPRVLSRTESNRLRRLCSWLELFAGDPAALKVRSPQADWNLEIPRAVAQLRTDWACANGALAGRDGLPASPPLSASEAGADSPRSRHDLGALAYCVFSMGGTAGVRLIHGEVAPGVRSRLPAWAEDRDGACCVRNTPEHRMLVSAEAVRLHSSPLPSSLSKSSLSLSLTPILDDEGEVSGWVHLEWEHHLIPDRECLGQLAASWASAIWRQPIRVNPERELVNCVSESKPDGWIGGGAGARLRHDLPAASKELCAPLFESCVESLGLKLAQRRWWAFVRSAGDNYFVTSGGAGLPDGLEHPGGARAIDRCVTTSGLVRFESPAPNLSIHAGSGSGVVLPCLHQGQVIGLLVIESSRRRDFKSTDAERMARVLEPIALLLVLAGFRAWHMERFGADLYFDGASRQLRELAKQMEPATRAQTPVVFSGPGGAGKRMLGRWLHWSRGLAGEEIHLFNPDLDFPPGTSRQEFARALKRPHGSVVLDDLPNLSMELQAELLVQLELAELPASEEASHRPRLRERLIVISPLALSDCMETGRVRPDLGTRLHRMEVPVAALVDRREDIPGLVQFMARRLAQGHGCRAPLFEDETIALLWRQRWKGNLPELEALLFKLVLLFPGEPITPDCLAEIARQYKFPLLSKLPSKRPRRRDLLQALRTTLKRSGRLNKRRAALYMGWDPDTLVLRLEELRLDESSLEL